MMHSFFFLFYPNNWYVFGFGRDDQIILTALLFYLANMFIPGASYMPLWRLDGFIITTLFMGPVGVPLLLVP